MNVNQKHKELSAKAKALRTVIDSYRRLRSTNAAAKVTSGRSVSTASRGTSGNAPRAVVVRQDPVRSFVDSGQSSGTITNVSTRRVEPSVRSFSEQKVSKPDFTVGKEVCREKLVKVTGSNTGQTREKVGIVHTNRLENKMPHAEFKYSSKMFIDEMGETVTGSEYLGTVYGNRATQDGAAISTLLLSPLAIRNTRLFQRCGLWNRFRFKHVAVEYIPTVAATVGGELSMAMSVDPTENPFWETPNGDAALRRIMAYSNSVNFNSFSNMVMHASFTPSDDEWYFIGEAADPRLEYQGQVLIQEAVQPAGAVPSGGWKYGLLRLHYEIEFCGATADVALAGTTTITQNFAVNSNATTAIAGAAVVGVAAATSSTTNQLAMTSAFTAGPSVNGVWQCTVIGAPSGTVTWQDAADLGITLSPGQVFYAKISAAGEWRFFSAVPGLVGDSSMDDSVLRWTGPAVANITIPIRADLIALTADLPI